MITKKIKIKQILFVAECEENIEGMQILFDDTISTHRADCLERSETDKNHFVLSDIPLISDAFGNVTTLSVGYSTNKDFSQSERITTEKSETVAVRVASELEISLILDFICKKDGLEVKKMTQEANPTYVAFDVSDFYKVIISCQCSILHLSDGKRIVTNFNERFNIKHGIVYEHDINAEVDDIDEDISGITDILK